MTINRSKLSQLSSSSNQLLLWLLTPKRYQQKMQIPINKILFVLLIIIINLISAELTDTEPCPYNKTINITNGEYQEEDGSIKFDGIYYTKSEYATYDYEYINNTYRANVAPHTRGCICSKSLKPCLKLCCNRGYNFGFNGCEQNKTFYNISIPVKNSVTNGVDIVNLFDKFRYTTGRPCNQMFFLDKNYPDEYWDLYDNGTLIVNQKEMNKNSYCIGAYKESNESEIDAHVFRCFEHENQAKFTVFPIGMVCSVPFLVVTFVVYACLPELRNVHGKSLMCYLLGLAFGYSFLSYIQLQGSAEVNVALCTALGYTTYFFFMSAFFWLSVISFDLWWNFRHFAGLIHNIVRGMKGISKLADNKKFLVYSAYAWLSSLGLVILCYFIDQSLIPSKWKPGFGVGHCFINGENKLGEFLYFYLIILIIICANLTFFILTALKIRRVQMEMARITAKEDSRRHQSDLDKQKDKYGLFLRLFIVMGVTWTMEVISWIINENSYVFYFSDILNTIQGVIIFLLFVMKPKVKQLIIKRWKIWRGMTPVQRGMSSSITTKSTLTTSTTANHTTTELSLINNVRD